MYKKYGRNDLCWCGSGLKYKGCHSALEERISTYEQKGCIVPTRDLIKTKAQIDGIRESGKINIALLDYVTEHIKEGITTEEINKLIHKKTIEFGGIPAPLGYDGYPKSVCTSINQEVCHGIPSEKVILSEGDIVNIDVTTIYKGYFSDSSRMFCIGSVSEERRRLVEVTKEALQVGLKEIKPWGFLGDMGQAIKDYAYAKGYSVVREVGGHGVGLEFHEEPFVSHVTSRGTEMLLVPGMVFTIEPMINMGKADVYVDSHNGWTIYTEDGSDSAQWEVTVAITENGFKILAY